MTTFALNNLWTYLQGLSLSQSDREWLANKLIMPLNNESGSPANEEYRDLSALFSGSREDKPDEWVDESLAKFHDDWGGNASPMEIANELRRGIVNSRTVETW